MATQRRIGIITLTLMSVSAIISLRNFPMMALYGWSSVFFYALSGLFFFIPIAFVCAELAAAWPKKGGVYLWVAQAFGTRAGILAIWLEWIESVVWLPAVLAFIASLLAYVIDPVLADSPYFLLGASLIVLWGLTALNYLNIQTSSFFSALGVALGTLVPSVIIIALAAQWVLSGNPTQIPLQPDTLVPPLTGSNLVFFTGVLLGFAGIEVAAYHIQDIENAQKNFPKATLMAAALILIVSTLGSLAIAMVVPADEISLSAGVMQAFNAFFEALDLGWLTSFIAALALIGALALVNTWIIGPSKGLLASAEHGDIPEFCRRVNRNQSPVNILLMQGIISTILSLAFLLMPSINSSYWLLTVMAAQLILLMYLMVFMAALWLRYREPDTPRPFRVPGGKVGIWLLAGVGSLACLFSFFIGFVPPEDIDVGTPLWYQMSLAIGIILFSLPPFFWGRSPRG